MRRFRVLLMLSVALGAALPASAEPPLPFALPQIRLTQIATASSPVAWAVWYPVAGPPQNYIAEQNTGRVRRLNADGSLTTILDIGSLISSGGERGLLGLTFSPFMDRMYVDYTNLQGHTVIDEYMFVAGAVVPGTRRQVLFITQPFSNHNGGGIAFGPDGFMYIPTGDGGSGGDPQNNGQRLDTLLGKVLRIDPLSAIPYAVPPTNPFVGVPNVRPEIWAYGMRNPWRWSFDRVTGDLWIADVGQNVWEEINFQPRLSRGGENYGWRCFEGTHDFNPCTPPIDHTEPIYEYSHSGGNCSVTGGYVYRGSRIPGLTTAFLFADFCGQRIQAVRLFGDFAAVQDMGVSAPQISSFGQDADGELYVLSLTGAIYRIDPR